MVKARVLGITLLALLASGCASSSSQSFDLQASQLELQIQSLQTRVDRLSMARGFSSSDMSSSMDTGAGSYVSSEDISSSDNAGTPGFQARGAGVKLVRGAANVLTGWVEIPKRIYETSQQSGALKGFTWGLVRGLGRGFVRTLGGAYEVITFPFPAPPHYRPIIQPEYVFLPD